MAINPETQYPGKIAPSTPEYPYGSARNITTLGDGTGTPWEAALVNDIFGFQQALLSAAGVVPTGTPDKVGASQYLEAVNTLIGDSSPQRTQDEVNKQFLESPLEKYTVLESPVLAPVAGTWEHQIVGDAWVEYENGKYYMYYFGADGEGSADIGYATSDNLINWVKNPTNPVLSPGTSGQFDDRYAHKATLVKIGSMWHMYYEAKSVSTGVKTIGLATAPTLASAWTKQGKVIDIGGSQEESSLLAPSVYEENGTYYMFYAGQSSADLKFRIFVATSSDGVSWTKQGKILEPSTDSSDWDYGWIAPGNVKKLPDGRFAFPFNGGSTVPPGVDNEPDPSGQGFAVSSSLVSGWTKSTLNPILSTNTYRGVANLVWRGHCVSAGSRDFLFVNCGNVTNNKEAIYIALKDANGQHDNANGIIAQLAANQTIPDKVGQDLIFEANPRRADGWFNPANPTEIVVPDGVSAIDVSVQVVFRTFGVTENFFFFEVRRNGSYVTGMPSETKLVTYSGQLDLALNSSTQRIDVQPGDVLTVFVFQQVEAPAVGNDSDVQAGARTFIQVRKVA